MQQVNKNGGGVMGWFFALGFISLVVAGVLYLRSEDNGFNKLARGVSEYNKQMDRMLDQHKQLMDKYAELQIQLDTGRALLGKTTDRMQMLEMRLDAMPKHQPAVVMPNKVSLQIDKPMELKWPAQPVQVIYREGPPVKFKKKPSTPLLDKAGITSRKASEAAAKRAADLNQ
jgi:IS5 family transposase